jgi:enamine deaminase RidA (YjgF/YER057c/UK114 family)
MHIERLAQMGLTLPAAPRPIGVYIPAVRSGNLMFLSGQLPLIDGALPTQYTGKLGAEVTLEVGQAAARQAVLNALSILHSAVGLDQVRRIVRMAGYVSSTPNFTQQPQVLNAASELIGSVLGEAGVHARLALGVPALPLDACIEIEIIAEMTG